MKRDPVTLVLLAVGVGSAAVTVVLGFVAWMLATAFAPGGPEPVTSAPATLALAGALALAITVAALVLLRRRGQSVVPIVVVLLGLSGWALGLGFLLIGIDNVG